MLDTRLFHHLVSWLGQWPTRQPLQVVGSERRIRPAWDGQVRPAVGVGAPGGLVLSVPPDRLAAVRELAGKPFDTLLAELPAVVGYPAWQSFPAVFRYSLAPTPLPDAGEWVAADDPVLPTWLRPFGDVLVARDGDGEYLAGVGIKRHDRYGHELSVGTTQAARGRGLARRLVAQAARRVLDEGAVPTYLHAPDNRASARVAEAAGFPDRGWTAYGVFRSE
ncbi:GNAT family N-acetyltransferase [Micromonospora sp. NBC_01796]|uniref:GNAT family N-acetyltransferase n=1 Tax=Micromonospora sp. NBC_01796 TaxID=2975987 RepID=UPI002DD8BBD2|nr:GNAT family N-acetyltransferase [Micromonospora sp. NBC_01796]WSA87280.1 GNAT family N-acetyltransferase [Micromonospora sp. NBC_01796]